MLTQIEIQWLLEMAEFQQHGYKKDATQFENMRNKLRRAGTRALKNCDAVAERDEKC